MEYEKKYKEALEVAKRKLCFDKAGMVDSFTPNDIYEMFPELKESEDEKIRKVLIELVKCNEKSGYKLLNNVPTSSMVAWLEKQGEQKSADKVEPKFKVGDWIIDVQGVSANQIIGYEDDSYYIETSCSKFYLPMKLAEKNYRLWTIQDANDGDVLAFNDGHGNDCIDLIKSVTDKKIEFWFCLTNGNRYEVFDGITPYTNLVSREDATPATKEQREQLKKAMADAGYTFDFEKKELKKIEKKSATMSLDEAIEHCKEKSCGNNACALEHKQLEKWLTELKELKEQKHAWSEEDEGILDEIIDFLENGTVKLQHDLSLYASWLKSLKDRYAWRASWEQLDALQYVYRNCNPPLSDKLGWDSIKKLESMYQELKKL